MVANSEFEADVKASFAAQGLMETLSAQLDEVSHGRVVISAPITRAASQQDGFAHAGFMWSLGDTAAGYAAMSMMSKGERVLTVEMKVNLLRPATGERLIAEGRVVRVGRQILTAAAEVFVITDESRKHVATMLGTMMRV